MAEVAAAMDTGPPRLHNAAVPPADGCCMLQLLPEELLRTIISYGDVRSNVRLAACSLWYRHFVFRDCPCAWKTIDFENVPKAKNLSDADLHTLLTNVDALKVTSSLSLMGCTSVNGRGLAALSYSRYLEQIDLRRTREEIETVGATGLDNSFIIGVLSTMPPINTEIAARDGAATAGGLKLVKIRRRYENSNFYESFSFEIRQFFLELNRSIAEHMKDQRKGCDYCKRALVDMIAEEDFHWLAPTCFCSKCKTFSCMKYCNYIQDCHICMDQFCEACGDVYSCGVCNKSYCTDCKDLTPCTLCNEFFCEECRDTMWCEDCKSPYCEECRDALYCSGCDEMFCTECRPVKVCNECEDGFCIECGPVVECQSCNFSSCSGCNRVKNARGCTCRGACSNCDIVCSCRECTRERAKQQVITKYFRSLDESSSAPKRPRLS